MRRGLLDREAFEFREGAAGSGGLRGRRRRCADGSFRDGGSFRRRHRRRPASRTAYGVRLGRSSSLCPEGSGGASKVVWSATYHAGYRTARRPVRPPAFSVTHTLPSASALRTAHVCRFATRNAESLWRVWTRSPWPMVKPARAVVVRWSSCAGRRPSRRGPVRDGYGHSAPAPPRSPPR